MWRVGIAPNLFRDNNIQFTKSVLEFLVEKNCYPILEMSIAEKIGYEKYGVSEDELFKMSEFIIVLGGDGTLLKYCKYASEFSTPILGINLGNLGYLTDCDRDDYKQSIEKVLEGNYKVEKRIMLKTEHIGGNIIKPLNALNDICITRSGMINMCELKVYVNDEYMVSLRADGIIVSTPTGSTAYNLSAGGPVLKPDADIVTITPICPHTLFARSIVVSANDKISIEVGENTRGGLSVFADGGKGFPLDKGDVINITKADKYATIIKTKDLGFYSILRTKLVETEE